jgi:hypothetical protein
MEAVSFDASSLSIVIVRRSPNVDHGTNSEANASFPPQLAHFPYFPDSKLWCRRPACLEQQIVVQAPRLL